jgi:DNA-binding response OmpR family regulator
VEQVGEKVNAFNAGADDYICKPVSGQGLLARVDACLRRSQWPAAAETNSVYSDAYLTIDFARREVYVDGENKDLTPIEYSLI